MYIFKFAWVALGMTHLKIVNIRKYASLTDLKILVNTPESSFTEGIDLICVKLPKPKKTKQKVFCSSWLKSWIGTKMLRKYYLILFLSMNLWKAETATRTVLEKRCS